MVTRLKTIEYHLPTLNNLADNTLTALTTKTIYIPEGTGTIRFRSVMIMYSIEEGSAQPTGNYTTRRIDVSVNSATATQYTSSNLYTGSGENTTIFYSVDATAHFNANWGSATSRSLAVSVLLDGSAAPSATPFVNVNVNVVITYEYDDTTATQIKTVNIPLNVTNGTLNSSKGTASDLIPALDTYLPEASKTYRDMFITVQGNIGATTNDSTLSFEIDNSGAYTSQIQERGAASDRWSRLIYNFGLTGNLLQTNITHQYHLWSNQLTYNHQQTWMTVTYEFDSTASNNMLVSLQLPLDITSPMGGLTTADAQRGSREFWVQESGVVLQRLAFYAFWDQAANISTLNWRMGTGHTGYISYTDAATQMCGGNACMIRNDSFYTLNRGRNKFEVFAYRTDTADFGFNLGGYFLLNYTANKPDQGYGAANHTVRWTLHPFTGVAEGITTTRYTGVVIPESDYFINAFGTNCLYQSNSTSTPAGLAVVIESPSGEGGLEWYPAYVDIGHTDPECGLRQCWAQARDYFKRWPGDLGRGRLLIESDRRWRMVQANASTAFHHLELYTTYHGITYQKTTNVTNSNGGVISLHLHRDMDGTDDKVLERTRTGDGTVDWTWYDNTTGCFITAYEDSTHVGRSSNFFF
jgi:hypothetical protein